MALATSYVQSVDIDLQPLDLSIRPRREDRWPLQVDITQYDPVCLTKTCRCDMASAETERLSPCMGLINTSGHRPHASLLSSLLSNTDFTFYTRRHVSSPLSCKHRRRSPYHLPPRRTQEEPEEDVPFQLSSRYAQQDMCTSSDRVISCHQHSHHAMYANNHLQKQSSLPSLPLWHADDGQCSCVNVDSRATSPIDASSSIRQSGNSPIIYSKWNTTEMAAVRHGNGEDKQRTSLDIYNPTEPHAPHKHNIRETLEATASLDHGVAHRCLQHGVAHRCTDKTHKPAASLASYSPKSQQSAQVSWQEHLYQPESSDVVSSSSPDPWFLCSDNPSSPVSKSKPVGKYKYKSHTIERRGVYEHLEFDTQQQLSSPGSPRLRHAARPHPASKENIPRKKRPPYRSPSTECDQVSTSTSVVAIMDNRHKRTQEPPGVHLIDRPYSENLVSTQVSILDFWISKFLWECSVEAAPARKPCHVDYICSESGQKRIRFRLVDLIELQVEQSLMA